MKLRHDYHLVDEIAQRSKTPVIRNIPIEKIMPNDFQPRKDLGELQELMESIKEIGLLEPIIVRPKEGNFEIIAGERRYRAALMAGVKELPCVEHDIPDNEALELSIIENIQRKDLSVFEEAQSLKSLADVYGYTHQEIAQKVCKSRVTVTELVRLTDMPSEIIARCQGLKINSKTFLLELAKLEDEKLMKKTLDEYEIGSFSRDAIKEQRKGIVKEKKLQKKSEKKGQRNIKFKITSDDKRIKIGFNFKKEVSKEELVDYLQKLIQEILQDKISGF